MWFYCIARILRKSMDSRCCWIVFLARIGFVNPKIWCRCLDWRWFLVVFQKNWNGMKKYKWRQIKKTPVLKAHRTEVIGSKTIILATEWVSVMVLNYEQSHSASRQKQAGTQRSEACQWKARICKYESHSYYCSSHSIPALAHTQKQPVNQVKRRQSC